MVKGGCAELEQAVSESSLSIDNYIAQQLPPGRVQDLCLKLNLITTQWLTKIITYISRELKRVTQYGIPETKTFTLVSNQLNTIFETMWAKRMMMQEFAGDATEDERRLYFARSIWITMQAHMIMAEFAALDFASHNLISSVFVRFLAE